MEVSSDDGFYPDDEEEEEEEKKDALSYAQVEAMSENNNWSEDERIIYHMQAAVKAGEMNQLSEKDLQAVVDQRQADYKEKQWALAEAQQGLVDAGSQMGVQEFVTGAQEVADKMTGDARKQQAKALKEEEDMRVALHEQGMEELRMRQRNIAELEKQAQEKQGAQGKKRATAVAAERGGKAVKPSKKGKHLFAQQRNAVGYH